MLSHDQLKAALSGDSILRVLSRDDAPSAQADIAARADRPTKNIGRDLAQLRDVGLIDAGNVITADGRAAVLAITRAGGDDGMVAGVMALTHAEIAPNPDNDRKDWESEDAKADLQALASDIHANGLLQNLVVRPNPDPLAAPEWILVGGERRWRAIGQLIAEGSVGADFAIACRRLDADDIGLRLAALSENLQRRALNPIEEAHAYRGLREAGLTTEQIADRVSVAQRHVQGRLQLLDSLSEADQARMTLPKDDPQHLGVKAAREMVQNAETKRAAREKAEAEYTPRQRLIIAEMRVAAGDWYSNKVQVDPVAMAADEDAVALDKAGILDVPERVDNEGRAFGQLVNRAWELTGHLGFGGYDADVPRLAKAYATALREELGLPEPEQGFSCVWLNGPFEISPELQARIDETKRQQEERDAEWKRQREEREAQDKAKAERWEAILLEARAERELQAAHPTARPQADRIVQMAEKLEHPLPWTAGPEGGLIDANGETVELDSWRADGHEKALCEIVALAVNSAAELATPAESVLPEDERPLSLEAFKAKMAEEIADLLGKGRTSLQGATADMVLDAYLAGIGEAFGHPDYDWTAAGAFEVVCDYEPPAHEPGSSDEPADEASTLEEESA